MATFSLDAMVEPTYIDILDIAAGYGILSTPVDGILTGDLIQMLSLVVTPAAGGAPIISKSIDLLQRDDGYFEYVTQYEIDGHFTLTGADIASIATGDWVYSCSLYLSRDGSLITREYQGGAIAPRPTVPLPPLLVNEIVITGGPYTGVPAAQHQLTATTYDGYGNIITGFPVTWASTNQNIASVDATGLVTLITPGAVTISATCQGVSDTTTITVSTAPIVVSDGDVMFYSSGSSSWVPHQPTADRILPGTFGGGSVYHFAHGLTIDAAGLTVTAGGFTVASGTSAIQALTATTGAFSGTLLVSGTATLAGLTATTGVFSSTLLAAGITSSAGLAVTGAATVSGTINGQTISATANFTGSMTIANGLTVTTGTTAVQAFTATTGTFSGTISGQLVNALTFGAHLTGGSYNNTAAVSLATDATSSNTAGTIVARDGSGNFAAGSITSATGITVTTGGITISAGTLAAQAITGTTGSFSSTLSATGDFAIATNKFTVIAASGNTAVAGTFGVTGVSTLGVVNAGALGATTGTFSGAVSAVGLSSSSGLTVSVGTSALQALTATTGTFSGLLTVSSGGAAITGNSTVTGTLTVSANTFLRGSTLALGVDVTGTNAAAGNILITAPNSTGSATPATIHFETSAAIATGTTPQTRYNVFELGNQYALFPYGINFNGFSYHQIIPGNVDPGTTGLPVSSIGATQHVGFQIFCGAGELADLNVQGSNGLYTMFVPVGTNTVYYTDGFQVLAGTTAVQDLTATQITASSFINAASYKVGGVAGVDFTGVAIASITVTKGLITSIS